MNQKIFFKTLLFTGIILSFQQNIFAENIHHKTSAQTKTTTQSSGVFKGELIDTMNAGGYTYVQIKMDNDSVWAAGPVTAVKKGDQISFNGRMPMKQFHSKALNQDFDIIYFVGGFTVNGKSMQSSSLPNPLDPHKNTSKKAHDLVLKDFSKAKNGRTIADVIENKNSLSKQTLRVRGQVSKFTADVLGKNWIHIRDSSSKQDLTITTDSTVALNDIITVEGKLALNKDFGYGYIYDAIIEDAKVSKN